MKLISFFEKLFNNLIDKYLDWAHPPNPAADRSYDRLMSMPIEEARTMLFKALDIPNMLNSQRAPSPGNLDQYELPPGVRELLEQYEYIGTGSGTEMSRYWLGFASELDGHDESLRDYIQIGVDAEDELIFVERNKEAIYSANLNYVASPPDGGVSFPSVFHWLMSEHSLDDLDEEDSAGSEDIVTDPGKTG